MDIRLHNSLTGKKELFSPLESGKVAMYHCGPTVYSSPHIGNFRAFLLADLLRRFFASQGYEVHQVMNITDVGHMTADDEDRGQDKMDAAAQREKLDPYALARKYEDEFRECLEVLRFRLPHELPRATEHIEQMGLIIGDLLQRGFAYQVNGNVYFDISRFPEYGKLSKRVLDELEEGARVAVNAEKRDPRDFALWKVDPKHLMQWPAPFAGGERGFPGWHIECSAMSMHYLGQSFDIHTGGEDNLFPHHECEIAQSEAHTGQPFVGHWLHVSHLQVDGAKMSKSAGNFFTVRDILERGFSGLELRYALMRVQYRQRLNFTLEGLEDARAAIGRVQQARTRLVRVRDGQQPGGHDGLGEAIAAAERNFAAALTDDLNTSGALAAVFGLVSAVNKAAPDASGAAVALGAFGRFEDALGVLGAEPEAEVLHGDEELTGLLADRAAARENRDFAAADRIRDQILERGYKVIDSPQGPRLEPR
jgi:cysteinyl-tRNA synthetase